MCQFLSFADWVLVLSLEVARWILMYVERAMRCRATSLSDVYVLAVGALSEGDLDVKRRWMACRCVTLRYVMELVTAVMESGGSVLCLSVVALRYLTTLTLRIQ